MHEFCRVQARVQELVKLNSVRLQLGVFSYCEPVGRAPTVRNPFGGQVMRGLTLHNLTGQACGVSCKEAYQDAWDNCRLMISIIAVEMCCVVTTMHGYNTMAIFRGRAETMVVGNRGTRSWRLKKRHPGKGNDTAVAAMTITERGNLPCRPVRTGGPR